MKQPTKSSQQMSFASYEYAQKKRVTRREKFLGEMEQVVHACHRIRTDTTRVSLAELDL